MAPCPKCFLNSERINCIIAAIDEPEPIANGRDGIVNHMSRLRRDIQFPPKLAYITHSHSARHGATDAKNAACTHGGPKTRIRAKNIRVVAYAVKKFLRLR